MNLLPLARMPIPDRPDRSLVTILNRLCQLPGGGLLFQRPASAILHYIHNTPASSEATTTLQNVGNYLTVDTAKLSRKLQS